jgi:hypothetical protein
MTRAEMLELTVERANAWLERELEKAEILLLDLGATLEEVENAIGPNGYARKMFREDRDRQVREVARWLAVGDATLH